ncbi:MAG TPA: folylpolyglutamate synthase/dihydrofolate synthase family protein [Candidatus Omnitrophota bacterium]|nr:bifunctional folylpolyglutamate synthase/dihydrofolate synthase [Candidatus Omnitrophota bacterium]HNQ50054.1 folylpolyglutamate synthase/dihydrofolate synthase family protein [Candidatus Omnitrophota bacterium]HQO37295.1 folylpolyglutamate synthase/dihydrofolate synthase family protein [Candidatus Omnitrophota bacterium]HQQ05807.1 folylpolyglutamate synthase/dihydrofolate synthase family protein [Candidatus Omnitrophota bacterium]
MSYRDTIEYLESFANHEKTPCLPYAASFKLERIAEFLAGIGDPHRTLRCIHVAGTKGKGSVCAFAASILRYMGYRVGLYTSPHLTDVRERIRVLDPAGTVRPDTRRLAEADFEGMIPEEELTRLTVMMRPEITAYGARSAHGPLSFFEVYTALAFVYFKEQAVDYAVLETGLGGRLDATNVVLPHIAGITPISFDHTNKLGNTLVDIAREKAGIIKRGTPTGMVITAPQEDRVAAVLRSRCSEQGCRLLEIGKDIRYEIRAVAGEGQRVDISGAAGSYKDIRLPLMGEHQAVNAAVAVGLVAGLFGCRETERAVDPVHRGLAAARWPGRFEIIDRRPRVILDGAHNAASAAALAKTLRQFIRGGNIILVLGISRDKDAAAICGNLVPLAHLCIATRADNPRARTTADIAAIIRGLGTATPVLEAQRVGEALDIAFGRAGPDGTIVVTGSLFTVGDARRILVSGTHEIS